MSRRPLPLKISTLGGELGAGLTAEQAMDRVQQLLERGHRKHSEHEGQVFRVLHPPPRQPMNGETKIRYLYERGRWPTPHEQEGWY